MQYGIFNCSHHAVHHIPYSFYNWKFVPFYPLHVLQSSVSCYEQSILYISTSLFENHYSNWNVLPDICMASNSFRNWLRMSLSQWGHTGCSICNFSATCNSSLNYTAYPFNFPLMGLPTYYVTFLFILVLGSPLIRTWAPCRAVCFVHCTFRAYTSAWQMLSTYYVFGKWLSAQHYEL